ncbi:hypothetical protein [Nocardioides sp. MH1]|uniref:hypothetical protein n=1 Tax=Nocardioides sp. MH1 TaxID=3242490 RepID=UPI00352273ED
MPWSITSDVRELLASAGEFLAASPVEHTPLLTEAAYLARRPRPDEDQSYGWWTDSGGAVAGAFVRAPHHPPVLTPMPDAAVDGLVAVLDVDGGVGCDVTTVDRVEEVWAREGVSLRPRQRLVIHRLGTFRAPAPTAGMSRTADRDDRALLHRWFDELMAAHPGDPSDREYVVDDPLDDGRIVLWEVEGVPVAMAGHTRPLHGMTRVGAVHVSSGDPRVETAVLAAACVKAAEVADQVLVLAGTTDREGTARLAALGYRAVRERVLLAPVT